MALPSQRALFRAATAALPVLLVAGVWHFGGLSAYRGPREVAEALGRLGAHPLGWALVPLGFAAGAALFVPVNALILGVTLVFEPLQGFAFALGGGLAGAGLSYGVGRLAGPAFVGLFEGPRLGRVISRLRASPFRTSLVLHLLPIGSFAAINLLAGALRVPFPGFLLGTALGLLPGVLFFAFVGGERSPGVIGLAAAALVLLAVGLRRALAERTPA